MEPKQWSRSCEEVVKDPERLPALIAAYEDPGPALSHFLGVILKIRSDIESQILRGVVDGSTCEDLTNYLRAGYQVCDRLLAFPSIPKQMFEQYRETGIMPGEEVHAGDDWPDPLD